MFHFVPCNYEKRRKKKKKEKKVLKIKTQEFKVPYSALKFREDKKNRRVVLVGGGHVRSG